LAVVAEHAATIGADGQDALQLLQLLNGVAADPSLEQHQVGDEENTKTLASMTTIGARGWV
jgi:hypothetical protein